MSTGRRRRAVGASVLVVEDHADTAELYASALRAAHYDVEVAVDGAHAILAAQRMRPNVILMDLALPRVNGWEAAQTIRHDLAMKAPWIIAVTARSERHNLDRAYAAGCDAVLLKPVVPAEIIDAVEVGLARARARLP